MHRPWIERGDRHIRCRLADGTLVAIHADAMLLAAPLPSRPGRWQRFVRAFCRRVGWTDVNVDTGRVWPSSFLSGDAIAGTSAGLSRHLNLRLAKARLHLLDDGRERWQLAQDLLHRWLGRALTPDVTPRDHLLLLTPLCLQEIIAAPGHCHARLHGLQERYPALRVLVFQAGGMPPRQVSIAQLLATADAATRRAAEPKRSGGIDPQAVEEGDAPDL